MLPRKISKIKGPRLAKHAFPEISAWKNWIKISHHVALRSNLGILKNCLLALGGGQLLPLPPTSYGPEHTTKMTTECNKTSERLSILTCW